MAMHSFIFIVKNWKKKMKRKCLLRYGKSLILLVVASYSNTDAYTYTWLVSIRENDADKAILARDSQTRKPSQLATERLTQSPIAGAALCSHSLIVEEEQKTCYMHGPSLTFYNYKKNYYIKFLCIGSRAQHKSRIKIKSNRELYIVDLCLIKEAVQGQK